MKLKDLQSLIVSKDSIKKIESFIAQASGYDYFKASIILAKHQCELDNEEEAISILFKLLKENVMTVSQDLYVETLIVIVDVYIKTLNFEDAKKYILRLEKNLDSKRKYIASLKLVNIYMENEEFDDALSLMINTLNDDLPDDVRIKLSKDIISIYNMENKFDFAIRYIMMLKDLCLNINDMKEYYVCNYLEAYNNYKIGSHLKAYEINLLGLENRDQIDDETLGLIFTLDINLLIKKEDYRKAMVNEAEYEEHILKLSPNVKREFFLACIDLYQKLENRFSLEIYQKRLDELVFPTKKARKIIKKKKEISDKSVVLTYKNDDELVYNILTNIMNIQEQALTITSKIRFRDVLLPLLIETSKYHVFDEMEMVFLDGYKGYHYKKERLYDKEYFDISNSIFYQVLSDNKEKVFTLKEDLFGIRDIVYNRDYELLAFNTAIAFPIFSKNEIIGVISFLSLENEIIEGFNYEILKYLSNLITDRYLTYQILNDSISEYIAYKDAFMLCDAMIKYSIDDHVFLNEKASKYFKISSKLSQGEFLSYVNSESYVTYKEFLNSNNEEVNYKLKGFDVLEKSKYTFKGDLKVRISILEDITLAVKKTAEDDMRIYYDSLTKAHNIYAYYKDIMKLIRSNKRFSMIMVDIISFKEINDCYQISFGNELLRNISRCIKEFFKEQTFKHYRISADDFLIILEDVNDIRSVERISKGLISYLEENVSRRKARVDVRFKIGFLRYPVQTIEKMPDKLLSYASFALNQSSKDNKITCFSKKDYVEEFRNIDLVKHINECIDLNRIGIKYKQVVNQESKTVSFYDVEGHIYDFITEESKIKEVIKLRGLTEKYEKYILKKALQEVMSIYEKYDRYFRIKVAISYSTIKSKGFIDIIHRVNKSALPKGLLTIDLVGNKEDISLEAKMLNKLGVSLMSSDFTDALLFNIEYFKVTYLNNYLETTEGMNFTRGLVSMCENLNANLLITNVLNKEEIAILKSLGVKYISYGKYIYLSDIIKKLEGSK